MNAILHAPARGAGHSPLATLRLVGHQFSFDLRSFSRNQQARFFTIILPVIFLVIFVGVFGNNTASLPSGVTVKDSTYYVPGLTAMGIISAAFGSLVVSIVALRESGILRIQVNS
jgi:ABC-2 type transport system permease protein